MGSSGRRASGIGLAFDSKREELRARMAQRRAMAAVKPDDDEGTIAEGIEEQDEEEAEQEKEDDEDEEEEEEERDSSGAAGLRDRLDEAIGCGDPELVKRLLTEAAAFEHDPRVATSARFLRNYETTLLAVSTRILGRRTAPFPPFLIPYRVPRGFTPIS